jgi:peroxidase
VDDIDLFIGGILERPLFEGGGTVGPTFTCILGDQFARLKRGDRYYYEEGNQPGSFTLRKSHLTHRLVYGLTRIF